jgi:hypothetical protein
MRTVAAATACLVFLTIGCTEKKPSSPQSSGTSAPPTTAAPTTASASASATPTPVVSAAFSVGEVFYSDTFKDTTKGWKTTETERAKYRINTDYAVKSLTVTAKKPDTQLFPHPEFRGITQQQLTDYEVAADVQSTLAIGHEDWMGVTCRNLESKFYSFQLQTNLETRTVDWRIAKHDGSDIESLARGGTDIGGSAWDVRGACFTASDGSAQLVMTVNGKEVGRSADADAPFAAGYGGVYLLARNGSATINVLGFAARSVIAS